ncbi:(p)ppGpp synthetase, RelA/SpoT family [Bellilinea caldifistulae]|uniref:(P)ppGpp synthetase n=1 Tax=Bellilinea caldifistulae TaxID=360411 RepID=A0A0P6WYW3_9CHLR|nr:bifunctional (p)ppGpp synthetase/guanosine-3',5'-bis(diphosphate) 3'-pyrophosphohydrolase [Bellilinea caldifistulae]KPL73797.1 (p)ppGpp synthetase [Bellilinea caldifistulae]GAP11066.1 (p)ppGpp synthetase, RelA/SpoT family [Bellilinea caldifistulae]
MKIDSLMEILPQNYSVVDREMVMRAYRFAEAAHQGQKRASGEPYVSHCLAVAAILAEMQVPPAVVIAGLLHDTVEDTIVTLDDIRKEFGDEVARLVDGVTKLTNLPRVSRGDQHGGSAIADEDLLPEPVETTTRSRRKDMTNETLRKVFLAMGDDIRVVLIKLADRLHNMRTLGYMPEEKRKRIAQQTLDIFAPLANRLGIWQIKWELEDLAFRYVNPEKYREIAENLAERRQDRERQIQQIIQRMQTILRENGIKAEISGRPKHIYSIYKKMVEKGKTFEMVRDLRAVRCIVKDIPSCYAALGVIHTHWRPIPQEFDDYIAAPKDNFYQSLHTAVIYDDGKPLEVQIRTMEMHQNAEYGIAAHWRYKERGPKDELYEQRINWLRKLMEWRQEIEDAQEFVEGMKSDVFQDRVYVFTPRGDIIDLPAGSTPIDFAYHVHTEIGNRCRGAKVNGKLVTLDYTLKTGDQVEILTAKQGGPSRDWLNPSLGLVKTQRARSKIRAWFKKQDREQNLTQGKAMFEKELRRLGITDVDVEKLAQDFDFKNADDLYVAIGCGDIGLGRVINRISDDNAKKDPFIFTLHQPKESKPPGNGVTVLGLKGLLTTFARCCNPAPGDEIVGYITRGRGATIHRQDCPNVLRLKERERIVKVTWGEPHQTYPVHVLVKAYDRQGLMNDISMIISNEEVNLLDIDLKVTHNLASIHMVVEVSDINQLSRVLTRIENLPNVLEAHRTNPG